MTFDNQDLFVVMGDLKKISLDRKRNEKEKLLEKFLMEAESHLMKNCPRRHTTVIAANNQLMKAVTMIFKNRPYFVGIDSKIFFKSHEYLIENCIFVFVDKIDYDYLSKIFSDLRQHYNTKLQVISTIGLSEEEVKKTLDLAYDKSIENVSVTFLKNSQFKMFQVYPFTRNCEREVRQSYVWFLEEGLEAYNYDDYSPRNLNKCPVLISTLPLKNTIGVHEYPNGTLEILGGGEGNLITTLAQKLNFTITLRYPEIKDWEGLVNNTIVGLVGEVVNKKSLIAIGQLRPTVERYSNCHLTASYGHECIVWAIPVILAHTKDILHAEFPEYLWAAILMTIFFSSTFICSQLEKKSSNHKETYVKITMDVISTTLGVPIHRLRTNQPGKIYFLSYIFYSLVLTVAYKTSLAAMLAVRSDVQLIKNYEDIVKSGITPGGSSSSLDILQNQRDQNPHMDYLIDNYEIVINTTQALSRLKYQKDFAYMIHLSTMKYYMHNLIVSGQKVYFYLVDDCIMSYNTVVLVRKGFILTNELNHIIQIMLESGHIDFWNTDESNSEVRNVNVVDTKMQKLTLSQLKSIFVLYLLGMALSIVIVTFELVIATLLS
ncbi:uncharacterized protein LOC107273117 isoform X2 [Cephus cinctus]|uniref:Uncharacterized protein LOC107273117 isoform X2 n=1 Tax=Cephus cinctus TaxID=211228 RepID=A0AAJ7W6G7_CEPCN|nr:uncharacterized protein LOC107273117 isoform X2 [Cephus cinctus]